MYVLPKLSGPDCLELLPQARVATLATVRPDGRIDLVPCTFAFDEKRLVTAVDNKPKSTQNLKRLENIRKFPEVSLLVHQYDDDDWDQLWWVRVRGRASVLEHGSAWASAIDLLCSRYKQYKQNRPVGPAINIDRTEVTGWQATS